MRRLCSCLAWVLIILLASATPASAKDPFRNLFKPQGSVEHAPAASRINLVAAQAAATPPEPQHTGLAAVVYKTAADFNAFPRRTSTWVILGLGAAGAAAAHPIDDSANGRLVGSRAVGRFFAPGKWVGGTWVQAGAAVGLYSIGRYVLPHTEGQPRTNRVSHLGFDLVRVLIVSQSLTQAMKRTIRRDRPTGECCAFPSGHASATFATAAVLERHLGLRGAWPTLAMAAYVAASRMHDNRHFLSDVIFGAALGTASGWTVVGRHGRTDYTLVPVPTPGGIMLALVREPRALTFSAPLSSSERRDRRRCGSHPDPCPAARCRPENHY